MKTDDLIRFLDTYLDIENIDDHSLNGLQVANSGEVKKVSLAVDASLNSFEMSGERMNCSRFVSRRRKPPRVPYSPAARVSMPCAGNHGSSCGTAEQMRSGSSI